VVALKLPPGLGAASTTAGANFGTAGFVADFAAGYNDILCGLEDFNPFSTLKNAIQGWASSIGLSSLGL
jgi:hypothetical protein